MQTTHRFSTPAAVMRAGNMYRDFQPPVEVLALVDVAGVTVFEDGEQPRHYRIADELHIDVDGSAGVVVIASRFSNWHIVCPMEVMQ
jgi:hypothetical protein